MRTPNSDYEIVYTFKYIGSFSVSTCEALRELTYLKEYSFNERLEFIREYRQVSKANTDPSGFKDYPDWHDLSIEDKITIRRRKINEFLRYLLSKKKNCS